MVERRHPAVRPDAARGGVRPTPDRQRARPLGGRGPRRGRRGSRQGGRGGRHRVGPGRRAQGRRTRSSRRRTGRAAVAPFENPAMASGWHGRRAGRDRWGALLAQGLAPYDAARLGVYLHGLAGEAVRERIGGSPACSPRTCRRRCHWAGGGWPGSLSGSGRGRRVRGTGRGAGTGRRRGEDAMAPAAGADGAAGAGAAGTPS